MRPGRGDYHASPIEEVTVAAKATDEYGLNGVTLHYSVNGGPETTVDLLQQEGRKTSRRLDHAFAGEFQAGSGRSGQRLRHREGRATPKPTPT